MTGRTRAVLLGIAVVAVVAALIATSGGDRDTGPNWRETEVGEALIESPLPGHGVSTHYVAAAVVDSAYPSIKAWLEHLDQRWGDVNERWRAERVGDDRWRAYLTLEGTGDQRIEATWSVAAELGDFDTGEEMFRAGDRLDRGAEVVRPADAEARRLSRPPPTPAN